MALLHESMRLHTTPDKFYIEPTDTGTNELLIIDRLTQELRLEANDGQIPAAAVVKYIDGILGIVRILAGPYLIVITKKVKVGEINGHSIWKIAGTESISYKKTLLHMNEQQSQDNARYLSMVEHLSSVESFYFSYSYDLSHTLQRLNNTSPEFLVMPLHERADQRFVWNLHLLREFTSQPELANFCLPVIHGFIAITQCNIKGRSFNYILLSRRQTFRAGTRYYMRGLDTEGYAANYVETEQIIEYEGSRSAFVQTRGSIPMYWSQRPNLKYKPDPVISSTLDHMNGFQRHVDSQIYLYGKQVFINLIDHKGQEDALEKAFAQTVKNSQNTYIRYEAFDFHKECSKMRWHRLSILLDRVAEDQRSFGYFMAVRDGKVICNQEGVFRTNCIDCLDRTNVVQSLMARRSLQEQLIRLGVLMPGEKVEEQVEFEFMFKNVWADNADACAKQYAGTGALKTDFTRKGKRTKFGLLKDGYNSAIRYFKNNFYDGFRQDSIDLFLGNYIVEEQEGISKSCPLREERDWKFYALPVIFMLAFSMCVISVAIPDENPSEQMMYVLFWGGASMVTLGVIYYYGMEFVDKPKLAQKIKTD